MKDRPSLLLLQPTVTRRSLLSLLASLPLVAGTTRALAEDLPDGTEAPDDVMSPVNARYLGLSSYSDKGSVETTYQWPGTPSTTERHQFQTAFRSPRNFFFRFDEDPAAGGDALVIWCDGGDFQSWWKATGQHTVYDGGRGANAFLTAQSPTKDSANLVAPLLFPQAKLPGPTRWLIEPQSIGDDVIDGRRCLKVHADTRVTGVVTVEKRPVTVWIDADNGLFVKALKDAEAGSDPNFIDRIVYTIEPTANPDLADDRFRFTPPEANP